MIDLQKLEPIHTFNTPRGRILKHTPKKIEKLDEISQEKITESFK